MKANHDPDVVRDFGLEWGKFDQKPVSIREQKEQFNQYFSIFPFERITHASTGFDAGCGSGRWAAFIAPMVGKLICIDASITALNVARENLREFENCEFINTSVGNLILKDDSMDFGYSLGVLHHIPDTEAGLRCCVSKLKPGAPFLLYLYYAFDNQPRWYKIVWRCSDYFRRFVSRLPFILKYPLTQLMALFVYLPLARVSLLLEKSGMNVKSIPLSAYRHKSFYTMRTDALDRFGTRVEQRFTKNEIRILMKNSGLVDIRFSENPPYWCALGYKGQDSI